MAETTITTPHYKLYPSPRNRHRVLFAHEVFVPYPYALIDLPAFHLLGKASLFAACRLSDMKMGQLVSFESDGDAKTFERDFRPD